MPRRLIADLLFTTVVAVARGSKLADRMRTCQPMTSFGTQAITVGSFACLLLLVEVIVAVTTPASAATPAEAIVVAALALSAGACHKLARGCRSEGPCFGRLTTSGFSAQRHHRNP